MKKILFLNIVLLLSSVLLMAQPDWTPVVYTNSTTAYGLVTLDGTAASTGDLVGAFVGTECRAKGEVILNNGSSYVTLLIQGESVEEVSFKFYDASADKIYEIAYTTNTSPGGTIGVPPDYLPLEASASAISDSLVVSPSNLNVGAEAGTSNLSLETNISWNVTETESWFSVTPTSGSNNETLVVSYDANTSASERVGIITISGNGLTEEVTVRQEGSPSTCSPDWEPVIYTNSTTAYGIVTIDGTPASAGDLVGAFVGSECRAVGEVILNNNNAYVTMLIQGEAVETVTFRIFDKSECTELFLDYSTQTNPGNTIGTPPDYLPISYQKISVEIPMLVLPEDNSKGLFLPIEFKWNSSDGATSYSLQVGKDASFPYTVADTAGILDTTCTILFFDDATDVGNDFYWRVKGNSDDGNSEWSEVWRFSTVTFIEAPILLEPADNSEIPADIGSIKFHWTPLEVESYTLQGSLTETFDSLVISETGIEDTVFVYSSIMMPGQFFWRVKGELNDSAFIGLWSEYFTATIITDVNESLGTIPDKFALYQNYPNPFNPTTIVKYGIPEQADVKIEIFNMLGQLVAQLVNQEIAAGNYETNWNAENLPSGIYLISIEAMGINSHKSFHQVRKALLIK